MAYGPTNLAPPNNNLFIKKVILSDCASGVCSFLGPLF